MSANERRTSTLRMTWNGVEVPHVSQVTCSFCGVIRGHATGCPRYRTPFAGASRALTRLASSMGVAAAASAFHGYEDVLRNAARYQQIRTNIDACVRPEWRSKVDRELWFRSRRTSEMDAVHSLWRDIQLGRWHPFTPLDLAAERARLAAWDARQAEIRRRFPRPPSPPEQP